MTEATVPPHDHRWRDFVEPVLDQADKQVHLYLYGEARDDPVTREQKEVVESIVATDYDGRTVIELLQNGHDAHTKRFRNGSLEVELDETAGEHGVLYVANAGTPLSLKDFRAICSLGLSTKRPDEGIGNKGVGFKSVLQLADAPEIYSTSGPRGVGFDGFRFRFALPKDFNTLAARVAPDRQDLPDLLRENVTSLKVPVPLDGVPADVAPWCDRGFVTVIRLLLRSEQACARARSQLEELESSDVPFHIFLDRVARVVLRRVTADDRHELVLRRRPSGRTKVGRLSIEHLRLQDGSRYVLIRRTVTEEVIQRAIRDSRLESQLGRRWESWKGDGEVAVALPLGEPLEDGRLYTFLPMGVRAAAPFPGFVNAPFFARLDRRSLDPEVPLNDLLLGEVALLCAEAVAGAAERASAALKPEQCMDLVGWDAEEVPRLLAAFETLGIDLARLPILPALGEQGTTTSLVDGTLWRSKGEAFTAPAVAESGVADLIDPALASTRRQRLVDLAKALDVPIVATADQLVEFAEVYANALAAGSFDGGQWATFFDDLAATFDDGAALHGREVLINADGQVNPASAPPDGPVVFVAPREEDAEISVISPPGAISQRLAFTHPGIPRRTEIAGPLRMGWRWLEQQDLVQEYRTESVLGLVGQTMKGADDDDEPLRRECLRFAFDVWKSATREVGPATLRRTGVSVPTASGWSPATEAVFGLGWPGPDSEIDSLLTRLLERAINVAPSLRPVADGVLKTPQDVIDGVADPARLREFLEALGAQHGLQPRLFRASAFTLAGRHLRNPRTVGDFGVSLSRADQAGWREVAARWPKREPSFNTTKYTPKTGVAILPGQREWDSLESAAKRLYAELVLHGLDGWPDSALEIEFTAASDSVRVKWPTFIAAFLAESAWIPQGTPGDRATVVLMPVTKAWWLRSDETPDYVRAQPAALRAVATERVLDRLGKIGVRFWDDPKSAADRLWELAEIAEGVPRVPIRKAYEDAWRDLEAVDGDPPDRLVVSRHGALEVTNLVEGKEIVYVASEDGVPQERLLAQAPVPLLAIRDRRLARRSQTSLEAAGATSLRSTSDAEITVVADGVPAEDLESRPLAELGGRWLPMLVLGVLEHGESAFQRVSESQLRHAERSLADAALATARTLVTSVDGHPVQEAKRTGSYALPDGTIVVAADAAQPWAVLQGAADAIAELVDRPAIAPQLRLALIDLETRVAGEPKAADVAAVLGVHVDEVSALLDDRLDVSDVVAILACFEVALAEELQDAATTFAGRDDLTAWLEAKVAPPLPEISSILEYAERSDPLALVQELRLDLRDVNAGRRALGLAPLHNPGGHERALEAYVQQHKPVLRNQLRDRFLSTAHEEGALGEYLRLRDLPDLTPAPDWLDHYWDVPEEAIEQHVQAWLDRVAPTAQTRGEDLPPVEELRDTGRRTVSTVVGNAQVLVDAWLHRHAAGVGNRPPDPAAVGEAMTVSGQMDFGRLTSADVVRWLHVHELWPGQMPLTTSRAELDLSEDELVAARKRLEEGREAQRRRSTFVEYGGRTYSDETEDLRELADALRADLRANPIEAPAEPQSLAELEPLPPDTRQPPRPKRPGRAKGPSQERTSAVGLAGEVVVGEWIERTFGVAPAESWQSGYRSELLGDGVGSDEYGYDFWVVTKGRVLLIEAKASSGDDDEFTFAESEVRRAQTLKRDEEYWVVFVANVFDPESCRIIPLPNPFAYGGLRNYRLAGNEMRLQFKVADERR